MIGGTDLSRYLNNFNSSQWANQANQQLQSALGSGLNFQQANTQQAINAVQQYNNQSQNQLQTGFNQAQALNAPQQIATYNALDTYANNLGLATPVGGSYQLAQNAYNSTLPSQPAPVTVNTVPQPTVNNGSGLLSKGQ